MTNKKIFCVLFCILGVNGGVCKTPLHNALQKRLIYYNIGGSPSFLRFLLSILSLSSRRLSM